MAIVPFVSSLIVLLLALVAVYIVYRIGKLIAGLVVNIILGFISILVLNVLFGLAIPFDLPAIVVTAIFGVLGAAVLVVLHFLGITL